jgi:hypothetical protein
MEIPSSNFSSNFLPTFIASFPFSCAGIRCPKPAGQPKPTAVAFPPRQHRPTRHHLLPTPALLVWLSRVKSQCRKIKLLQIRLEKLDAFGILLQSSIFQLPMNEDGDELLKPQSCPSSSSATCQAAPPAAPPMLGRRFLGTLFVSLPEGAVLECRDAGSHQPAEGGVAGQLMSAIIRPGDSLLALLHGKGAQTMLLNAFCGHPRRRMYARLKWSVRMRKVALNWDSKFDRDWEDDLTTKA